MKNLKINLKKEVNESYEIEFVENTGKALSDFVLEKKYNKILLVSDTNVYPLYFTDLLGNINAEIKVQSLELQAGEEFKNMDAILKICSTLVEYKFNRNDCIIALGGGVIGDMVGFAGSIFKRGMNVIQIPTTLLSMFDSSVGGKTGIDFNNLKNVIGNFKQPKKVFINPNYLKTLTQEEILSGYFEGLKHSLLQSREYYDEFKNAGEVFFNIKTTGEELNEIIGKNLQVKAKIVMEDEHEMGVRKFLNYGHTFGHALEGVTNFSLSHGVCVGFGMMYVNILSNELGFLSEEDLYEINTFIKNKLSGVIPLLTVKMQGGNFEFNEIYSQMTNDKKNIDTNISFTLLDEPGSLHIEKVGNDKKAMLKKCFNIWKKRLNSTIE